jgi:hypothetical protein
MKRKTTYWKKIFVKPVPNRGMDPKYTKSSSNSKISKEPN